MEKINKKIISQSNSCEEIKADKSSIIIFGASGDLTSRKLIPAIFKLFKRNLLSENFYVLGVARTQMNDQNFRDKTKNIISNLCKDEKIINRFLKIIYYQNGQYNDINLYKILNDKIKYLDDKYKTNGNNLFYFATPPDIHSIIIKKLGEVGLNDQKNNFKRVIIEKPFGSDLNSSNSLDDELHKYLEEQQIYRIDHYLGKETVQNIMMLRFANIIFEPIWNYKYIDNIQITVSESLGIGHRAGYFENAGLLRDMFQNHMLQLLTLVAMEPPASLEPVSVRNEKVKLLKSIRPFNNKNIDDNLVRGQYISSKIDDEIVPGYREEKNVAKNSCTETYVAGKFFIDNWRWSGVPFYLRSGKRLKKKLSQIAIIFKDVPHSIFSHDFINLEQNSLILNVQPDEGFSLYIQAKQPGSKLCLNTLNMDFKYKNHFDFDPPEAYERLILDALIGDQTLFVRSDAMKISWELLEPIINKWKKENNLNFYEAGTWGPKESNRLFKKGTWYPLR
jgi:glucose-6-phosphate 1-dehydrogenase